MGADNFYQLPMNSDGMKIATVEDSLGNTQYTKVREYPSFFITRGYDLPTAVNPQFALFNTSTTDIIEVLGFKFQCITPGGAAPFGIGWTIGRISAVTGSPTNSAIIKSSTADSLPANMNFYHLPTSVTLVTNARFVYGAGVGTDNAAAGPILTLQNLVNAFKREPGEKPFTIRQNEGIAGYINNGAGGTANLIVELRFITRLIP